MDFRLLGILAALGSAASWAIGAILFKRLGEVLSPLAMTLLKGAISLLFLAAAMLVVGLQPVAWEPLALLAISGVLGIALADTFFFAALQDLSPQPLLVLGVLGMVLTVLLEVLWLGKEHTAAVWMGITLIVVGVGVVLQSNLSGEKATAGWRGVAFGLASVVCTSISLIVSEVAMGAESDTIQATFVRMLAGTLGLFLFGAATRRLGTWVTPFRGLNLVLLFLISVSVVTFGGFWLSLFAVKHVGAGLATTLISTEVVFAIPLAAIFLKQKVAFRAIIGTIAVLAGVVFLFLPGLDSWLQGLFSALR
jgi:drug/metabolite transporter (DMT)-like permease